jgi:hypothetical protein
MARTTKTPEADQQGAEETFDDEPLIEAAIRRGVRQALLRHKQAGVPIVVRRDGKLVEIPADEIEIGPE